MREPEQIYDDYRTTIAYLERQLAAAQSKLGERSAELATLKEQFAGLQEIASGYSSRLQGFSNQLAEQGYDNLDALIAVHLRNVGWLDAINAVMRPPSDDLDDDVGKVVAIRDILAGAVERQSTEGDHCWNALCSLGAKHKGKCSTAGGVGR